MNSSDACRPQVNYNNALPGTIWCMLTILCAILKRLFLDWNCYAVAGDGRCHYGNHSPERRDVIGDSTFSRRLQDRPKRKFWYQSRRARNFGAKQAGFPKTFSQSSEESWKGSRAKGHRGKGGPSCYWRCCRLTNKISYTMAISLCAFLPYTSVETLTFISVYVWYERLLRNILVGIPQEGWRNPAIVLSKIGRRVRCRDWLGLQLIFIQALTSG